MIGANRRAFNVFFLRGDEGVRFFPEVSVDDVCSGRITQNDPAWLDVKDMRWKEVEI